MKTAIAFKNGTIEYPDNLYERVMYIYRLWSANNTPNGRFRSTPASFVKYYANAFGLTKIQSKHIMEKIGLFTKRRTTKESARNASYYSLDGNDLTMIRADMTVCAYCNVDLIMWDRRIQFEGYGSIICICSKRCV